MAGKEGHTNTGADQVIVVPQMVNLIQYIEDLAADGFHPDHGLRPHISEILQHQHKLISPQTCHGIPFPHTGQQTLRHLHQQHVSNMVAQGIVQILEFVQIDKQQGTITLTAGTRGHRLLQAIHQQATIGEFGEQVVKGELPNLILRRLVLGDVDHGGDIVGGVTVPILDGGNTEQGRVDLTLTALTPKLTLPDTIALQRGAYRRGRHLILGMRHQCSRILFQHLCLAITGDLTKGAIAADNPVIHIGDIHPLHRLERHCGEAKVVLHTFAFGNVLADGQHSKYRIILCQQYLADPLKCPHATITYPYRIDLIRDDPIFHNMLKQFDNSHPMILGQEICKPVLAQNRL